MLVCYTERIRADSDHFKTVLLVLICSPYALVLQAPFCNIHTSSESLPCICSSSSLLRLPHLQASIAQVQHSRFPTQNGVSKLSDRRRIKSQTPVIPSRLKICTIACRRIITRTIHSFVLFWRCWIIALSFVDLSMSPEVGDDGEVSATAINIACECYSKC